MNNIIVKLDDSGMVQAVYCPDKSYNVFILDYSDNNPSPEVKSYYKDLEKESENLTNCW